MWPRVDLLESLHADLREPDGRGDEHDAHEQRGRPERDQRPEPEDERRNEAEHTDDADGAARSDERGVLADERSLLGHLDLRELHLLADERARLSREITEEILDGPLLNQS